MRWLRLGWFLGMGVTILLGTGCQDRTKHGGAEVKRQVVSGVQVAELRLNPLPEYYQTTATVRASTVSAVASKVMGVVTAIYVKEGDIVAAGQDLLTIDNRDLVQRLKAAEAAQLEARKALDAASQNRSLAAVTQRRYQQLFQGLAISRQEMDQVDTQLKVAGAEAERAQAMVARAQTGVAEAQIYLGYARIVAPAAGVVVEKRIDVGSMAVPGTPLLVVEDQSAFRLEINVDESLSSVIKNRPAGRYRTRCHRFDDRRPGARDCSDRGPRGSQLRGQGRTCWKRLAKRHVCKSADSCGGTPRHPGAGAGRGASRSADRCLQGFP